VREAFEASRQGLKFGAPKQALPNAISSMHAMERAELARRATASSGVAFSSALSRSATASGTWFPLGPQPMSEKANFTGNTLGNNAVMTGRVTSIAADQNGLIVVGTASGGLWISTNNGSGFVSMFDSEPTEAIGAIALDTTTTPSTIYVGTGEGNNTIDSLYGQGLFKSSDLGQTWTQLGPPGTFVSGSFTSLSIDTTTTPGTPRIFAGITNGYSGSRAEAGIFETQSNITGLWFSSDGGSTWSQYPESAFNGCDLIGDGTAPCPADAVVVDPNNPKNVYAAIDTDDVYYSNNGGQTFTATGLTGKIPQGRDSIAVGPPEGPPLGPSNPPGGIVYAMVGSADGVEYLGLFVSFTAGTSWHPGDISPPSVPQFTSNGITIDGSDEGNFSQSFYDQAMVISPSNPGALWFGGVGLYGSGGFGHTWTFLPANGGIHADVHALTWDPANNQILAGTDGGLYMFSPTTFTPTFVSLNQNINSGLIQGIGPHPTNNSLLVAGFQSNGTQLFSGSVGNWNAPDSESGDGGFAFYDIKDPNYLYHDFSLDQINGELISASSDGGAIWCSDAGGSPCNSSTPEWTTNLINLLNTTEDPGPVFYAPLAVDPSVAHRVWFGAHSVYVSTDGMAHWQQQTDQDLTADGSVGGQVCEDETCALEDLEFGPVDGLNGHPAWALAMSSLTGTIAFALNNTTQANIELGTGNANGAFWSDVTSNLNSAIVHSSPDSGGVLSTQATTIAPDPGNSNVAYIGLSGFTANTLIGHIFKTVNFGATWTEADGGLPDVPVLKLLVDSTDLSGSCGGNPCSNSIFAGTDIGVFHSSDGGNSWQAFNQGVIPVVPVYDLEQNTTGTLFAGTHGRGAFGLGVVAVTATPTATGSPFPTATRTPTATPTQTVGIPTRTPTTTATRTTTATATTTTTPTATATPFSSITFVGAGALFDTSSAITTITIALPAGVEAGDTMIAQVVVHDGTASDVPAAPAGWTLIRHDAVNATDIATSWLYYRVAGASEPASYSWTLPTANFAVGVMGDWRGGSVAPIENSSGATNSGFAPITASAPSLTPANNNDLQLYFYASQAATAPPITLANALNKRFNTGSTKEGFTLAIGDLAAPFSGIASPTYPASTGSSGSVAITAQAILITSAFGSTPTPTGTSTPTGTVTATATGLPTPTTTPTTPASATATVTRTPTPTITATTTRTATVTATPTGIPTRTATPTGTPTGTATQTPTVTATATPSSSIAFVAAGTLTDSSIQVTKIQVFLPAGVASGDILITQVIVHDGTGTDTPIAPSGWTLIRHDSINSANLATSWLYYHLAGASEPTSYTWTIAANFAAGVMGDWRNVSISPVENSSGAATSGVTPISLSAPSLTPVNNNDRQIYFYGSQAALAPTVTLSSSLNKRFNVSSTKEGFTLAFGDIVAPFSGNGSPLFPATSSGSGSLALTAQAILLISATGPTPTPTTPPTPTATPTAGSPTATPTGGVPTATGTTGVPTATPTGGVPTITMTPTPNVPTATPTIINPTATGTTTRTATPTATETPTLVKVGGFRATSYSNGTHIQWQSGYQPSNLGFSVYREENGQKVLISPDLIAGAALLTGPKVSLVAGRGYSWWDSYANAGTRYWIQELDISGNRTFYGPIIAANGTGNTPGTQNSPLLHDLGAAQPAPQMIVHPAGMLFVAAKATAKPSPTATPLAAQTAIKLGVSQPGWYHVPLTTLTANGLKAGNGNKLHLFAEGVEQPLEIKSGGVEFYGTGLDTQSTDTRVYWLVNGAVSKDHVATSKLKSKVNAGADFLNSVELQQRITYFPAANAINGIDFFGQFVDSTALDQTLTTVNLSSTDNAMLEVGLQGAVAGPHSVTVELNGVMLDTVTFNGLTNATFELPASSIENGANTITLTSESAGDISLVDHLTLSYEQTFTAVGDTLEFTAPGSNLVTVTGFTNSKVRMIDITDPSAPEELSVSAKRPKGATTYTATATAPGTGTRTILAFGAEIVATPDSVMLHTPATLTPFAGPVDTIMITTSTLMSALQPLAAHRESQGLNVTMVDIAQVYDAFNYGEKDPVAIQNFLLSTQSAAHAPHYVLLVGDASYDPRNFLGLAAMRPDLVPTKLINTDAFQALSDGWFADFQNNNQTQMAIGRLPAIVSTDVTALVNKIIAYDTVTPGNSFLLASDASDSGVTPTFTDSSTALASLLPSGATVTQITRDPVNNNSAALISAIDAGPDLVNYIGHGNENTWGGLSSDQNWLTDTDTPSLTNSQHPAVFAMMTCLSGFFADPQVESLAESLLTANGGAVAVWASSGLTVPSGQVEADQTLYGLLFTSTAPPVGEATRQAQNSSSDPDVQQTWNLLGDPETNLR